LSGSLLLGQFAGLLGASIFGWLILLLRNRGSDESIVLPFSLLEGALLVSGYFFASLPALSALFLALAPAPALLPVRSPNSLLTGGIRAGFFVLCVAAAIALAYFSSPPLDY
jgi:hypothetical protein